MAGRVAGVLSSPRMSAEPAVQAFGVCRRFGRRWALIDVNVTVPRGTALMVAGRNGSGKSTLFRVLSTAIGYDRGSVRIEGRDAQTDRDGVRRHIALLSHYLYHYEPLTPLQNLEVAARIGGLDDSRDRLMSLLEEVNLAERAHDAVSTFSAGMRKRLAIARVLLQDASVVLLDEPYGQLDPPGFRFVDRLFQLLRDRGVTVLLSTHQIHRGAALCDDGLVLEAGRAIWSGPARELPSHSGLEGSAEGPS
jgi:heme exporter protein A